MTRPTKLSGEVSLSAACSNLELFVSVQAEALSQLLGFEYYPTFDAPADYRTLRSAFHRSRRTGCPLPVSHRGANHAIYGGLEGNIAFRFWHDVTHLRLGKGFDLPSETKVVMTQLNGLRAIGFGPGCLEFDLLHADTLGHVRHGLDRGQVERHHACATRLIGQSELSSAVGSSLERRS